MAAIVEGTVKAVQQGTVVISPRDTNYELYLATNLALSAGQPTRGTVKLKGRKVWTIPAGGSFIQPLLGEPRVVQGMVKAASGNTIVVQAGLPVCIELPAEKNALDLKNGSLQPGVMVNVTIFPGATFEAASE